MPPPGPRPSPTLDRPGREPGGPIIEPTAPAFQPGRPTRDLHSTNPTARRAAQNEPSHAGTSGHESGSVNPPRGEPAALAAEPPPAKRTQAPSGWDGRTNPRPPSTGAKRTQAHLAVAAERTQDLARRPGRTRRTKRGHPTFCEKLDVPFCLCQGQGVQRRKVNTGRH